MFFSLDWEEGVGPEVEAPSMVVRPAVDAPGCATAEVEPPVALLCGLPSMEGVGAEIVDAAFADEAGVAAGAL